MHFLKGQPLVLPFDDPLFTLLFSNGLIRRNNLLDPSAVDGKAFLTQADHNHMASDLAQRDANYKFGALQRGRIDPDLAFEFFDIEGHGV